jgi:hypothetical protein
MKGFLGLVITALVMSWIATQASNAKAAKLPNGWIFRPVLSIQLIFLSANLMGFLFVIAGYLGPPEDRAVVLCLGLLFLVFTAVAWPKAISSSEMGLRQQTWWFGWKIIDWEQVSSVEQKKDESIVVRSEHTKIVFLPYHADRKVFLQEIERRSSTTSSD